jgi:hypothetical protein
MWQTVPVPVVSALFLKMIMLAIRVSAGPQLKPEPHRVAVPATIKCLDYLALRLYSVDPTKATASLYYTVQ